MIIDGTLSVFLINVNMHGLCFLAIFFQINISFDLDKHINKWYFNILDFKCII